jgi:DNA processing protein
VFSDKVLAAAAFCSRIASAAAFTPKQWNELEIDAFSAPIEDFPIELRDKAAQIKQSIPAVEIMLSELNRRGVEFVIKGESDYPKKLSERLKYNAPPIFYCAGELSLFNKPGIALTGSRDISDSGREFAQAVGLAAARGGYTLISGGARGADTAAASAALRAGGTAVLYLPANLLSLRAKLKRYIDSGKLLLCSAQSPTAEFSRYAALGRNQYIYLSAEKAFVAESREGIGGSFDGARQNIRRNIVPTYVYMNSAGNTALYRLGAIPVDNIKKIPSCIN